jgi:tetratricopeptide (TPR) repeat protein
VRCESAGLGVSAGMIALDQGKLDEAFELAGTNVDVLAAILVELPEDRETRGRLLIGRGLLAEVFAQQNRWVEAEAEIHRMLELEASLAGDFSAIVRYRSLPTGIYAQLAGTAARAGRVETAQLLRRAAIRAGEALVGRFPEELCQTTTLGGEYVNLGLQLTGLEQRDEALSCFDRAVELLDQTHAKRPEDPKATLFCRNAHGARATCLESLRRFAEAAADWEAAAQLGDASFRHMAEENRIRCLEAAKGIAEEHALPEKH